MDSFLAAPPTLLLTCAQDSTASRVVEAFLTSPTFHFHVQHKLLDKFRGHFSTLAGSRFGSFVLEKGFKIANKSRKVTIAAELAAAEDKLGRSPNGPGLALLCSALFCPALLCSALSCPDVSLSCPPALLTKRPILLARLPGKSILVTCLRTPPLILRSHHAYQHEDLFVQEGAAYLGGAHARTRADQEPFCRHHRR